jgi:serine/threonine protein phosphatase 1
MALMAKLPAGVPVTFAGDLIDRGPDSRKVIEFVKNGGYDCVVGNHEVMMVDELRFRTKEDGTEQAFTDYYTGIWEMNGGDRCLQSYLIDNGDGPRVHDIAALKEHLAWLKTLPYHLHYDNLVDKHGQQLLVTHTTAADVWGEYSPENSIFKNSVIWDRENFPAKIEGIYNVYGHTPQKGGATVKKHFACIDTGAYFKGSANTGGSTPYGRMTALMFPEMTIIEQENVE